MDASQVVDFTLGPLATIIFLLLILLVCGIVLGIVGACCLFLVLMLRSTCELRRG